MKFFLQLVTSIYIIGWLFLTLLLMIVSETSILTLWIPYTLLGLFLMKKAFGKVKEPKNKIPVKTVEIPPIPTPVEPSKKFFSFRVAGVTKKNDEDTDIQTLMYKNAKAYCNLHGIDLYNGYTNRELISDGEGAAEEEFADLRFKDSQIIFTPEPTNIHDKNAIKVFIKYTEDKPIHIGYVPKDQTNDLVDILENKTIIYTSANHVGGKIKEVIYDFDSDKDIVITKELTLGMQITICYEAD